MLSNTLKILMIVAVLANQVIAGACHSHGEPSDSSSRPHLHLDGRGHVHSHLDSHAHLDSHSHFHAHGHSHSKAAAYKSVDGNDDSVTGSCSHDCDIVFLADSHSVLVPTPVLEEPSGSNLTLEIFFRVRNRIPPSIRNWLAIESCWPSAHALMLKKIRMLL